MKGRTRMWIVAGVVALGIIGGGAAIALGTVGDDDQPLRGSNLDRATRAALAHTGGGTVIETEVGDDGAAYGVEIRLDDGRVVEVNLDANYQVIGDETDDDGTESETGPDDD